MLIAPKEKLFRGWKDGSGIWCACSHRGPWLDFQLPHGTLQIVCNSSARYQIPSPELCIYQTCMRLYSQTCRQNTHTNKSTKDKSCSTNWYLPGQLKSILCIIEKNNPSVSTPSVLPEVLNDPATVTPLLHKASAGL